MTGRGWRLGLGQCCAPLRDAVPTRRSLAPAWAAGRRPQAAAQAPTGADRRCTPPPASPHPAPAAPQVGSTLFAHGGVLRQHVDYGLERINAEAQVGWHVCQLCGPAAAHALRWAGMCASCAAQLQRMPCGVPGLLLRLLGTGC